MSKHLSLQIYAVLIYHYQLKLPTTPNATVDQSYKIAKPLPEYVTNSYCMQLITVFVCASIGLIATQQCTHNY